MSDSTPDHKSPDDLMDKFNHPDDVHMETVHMRKERFLKSRGIDLYMNKMINEVVLVNIRYVDTTEMVVDGMSRFCCL